MKAGKISKNTWAVMALTTLLSIFGGWSAGNEKQAETIRRVSVIEAKCEQKNLSDSERYIEQKQRDEEIIEKLNILITEVGLLKATKADKKYAE